MGFKMFNSSCNLLLAAMLVLLSPASSLLTDPGPLCDGQSATLTCNITGGDRLIWDYRAEAGGAGVRVATINPSLDLLPSPDPVSVLGIEFTVSLLMPTSPHFVSQISFQASTMMNGGVLSCIAVVPMVVDENVSLQVANSPGHPENVSLVDLMNGTSDSEVTIQWTPPSGENLTYTIVITPPPVSGVVMDTDDTEITVTLLYNTPYTTSVSTSTPCRGQPQEISFELVACEIPVGVSDDVILPISGPAQTLYPEGSEIMYQCRPGLQPNRSVMAVCGNNGRWSNDPALHNCIVVCSDLVLPSNANGSIGEVTSTTEGSTVNFQCEEGLLPSEQSATQIQCTRVNNMGQWIPNPATLVCGTVITSSLPVATIVIPLVVVIALIASVVAVLAILIYVRYRKGAAAKGSKEQNSVEMYQATPEHKAEYHTLQSRGYNADQDEYSTVHHNHHVNKTADGEEYSEVRADTKLRHNRKANVPSGDVSEYNQLNTNPAPPDPSSNLVYADLGTAMPQKKKKKPEAAAAAAPVVDQDKVVYAAIDPKATAALKKEIDAKKIPACNLDIMLIQVKKEVAPLWYEYGVVLALPDNVLKDIMDLEMSDNDKLVEVLDYWFRKFPPGGGPTWKEVSLSIREIGLISLADKLLKVETTGELPIEVSTRVEALEVKDAMPPPVPPKMDSDQEALIPPPRTGSLKQQPPPRPPKAGTQTLPAAPPRPPKTQPSHLPARPPKPGLT